MHTLIISNNCKDRWYPIRIDTLKACVKLDDSIDGSQRLKSNIAYSIQYIHFIEKQLEELKLSGVIEKMLIKTYIITGMGIIEGLFTNLLKSNSFWKKTKWKLIADKIESNAKKIDGKMIKVETEIYEEVEEFDMRMDLDSMIKRIESKKLLTIEHDSFPTLKRLRELRNRVHIHLGNGEFDHDFNSFNLKDKELMGKILYTILTSSEFFYSNKGIANYEFLEVNLDKSTGVGEFEISSK